MGAARPFPTDTGSLFTFADKPEIVAVHTSQEVTETSHLTPSQTTTPPTVDPIPPPHTGSQPGIISAGMSATSADISPADVLPPQLSYYGDVPIAGSFAPARASIRDTTVVSLSASARVAPAKEGEGTADIPPLRVDRASLVTEPYRAVDSSQEIHAWRQATAHAQT